MSDFKNTLMDSHLKRVERWLKRCITACKCGLWSDALAEAECLEAETKGLREKLWSAACDDAQDIPDYGVANSLLATFKITFLAMAMVFTAVIPISLDSESGVLEFAPQRESVVLLSSTESDIINALRESLSSGNSGRVVFSIEETPEEITTAKQHRGAAMATERSERASKTTASVSVEQPQTLVVEEIKTARSPSAEEVISLIQVGQRALQSSEPGVIIVP